MCACDIWRQWSSSRWPVKAQRKGREEKRRQPLLMWPAAPPFYHDGQKGCGFKRSKLFYLWDHNGGVNNTNKIENRKSATFGVSRKEEPVRRKSITAAWINWKVERRLKFFPLTIRHRGSPSWTVRHREFLSSLSGTKDADAELNPFKEGRWAESSWLWSTTAGFINFTMAVMVPPGTFCIQTLLLQ